MPVIDSVYRLLSPAPLPLSALLLFPAPLLSPVVLLPLPALLLIYILQPAG